MLPSRLGRMEMSEPPMWHSQLRPPPNKFDLIALSERSLDSRHLHLRAHAADSCDHPGAGGSLVAVARTVVKCLNAVTEDYFE
jgi:hypothetical protein